MKIRLENQQLLYDPKSTQGLTQVNFVFDQKLIYGIVGPSGAGKSTLFKLIQKSGESAGNHLTCLLNLKDLVELEQQSSQELLGDWIKKQSDETLAREIIEEFELAELYRYPIQHFSAGQRCRFLIAQKIMNQPSWLLIDDLFDFLDRPLKREIMGILISLSRRLKIGLIFSAHDLNFTHSFANHVLLIHSGKLVQSGTYQELIQAPKNIVLAEFLGHQNFISIDKQFQSIFFHSKLEQLLPKKFRDYRYFLLPPESLQFDPSGPYKGTIKNIQTVEFHQEIEVCFKDLRLFFSLPKGEVLEQDLGKVLRFSIHWNRAILCEPVLNRLK
jgi:ABC-type cobalamin/Fe3+-siderophores transport system ATPase subunit